jgi:hypothetical protein
MNLTHINEIHVNRLRSKFFYAHNRYTSSDSELVSWVCGIMCGDVLTRITLNRDAMHDWIDGFLRDNHADPDGDDLREHIGDLVDDELGDASDWIGDVVAKVKSEDA